MNEKHYAANTFKSLCLYSLMAMGMAACSSDEQLYSDRSDAEITFTAAGTRAEGTTWAAGDKIGVYMTGTGQWTSGAVKENAQYQTADGTGFFTPTTPTDALKYPSDATATYDFTAYYPYSTATDGGVYKVDVTNQSKPEAIDLMYADNLKNQNSTQKNLPLQFTHKLAQVVLNITSTDGKDISTLKADILSQPATADFNLKDGTFGNVSTTVQNISMYTAAAGNTLTAKAFLLPQAAVDGGLKVRLATADGSKTQEVALQDGSKNPIIKLESGKTYTVNVNVKNVGTDEPSVKYEHYTETPLITYSQQTSTDLQYVRHYFKDGNKEVRNYSMLYDKNLKVAYWVAYPLCNYYLGKTDRTKAWAYDPNVDKAYQVNIVAGSYNNKNYDFDRGHQLPSGDRTVSYEANAQTFYATNMTPQVGKKFNQTIWADLEGQVRGWTSNNDTLFVVTGAGFYDKNKITYTTDKEGMKVAVPDYYYKALLDYTDNTNTTVNKMIAFKLDNKNYDDRDFMKYAISVAELEKLTGITFFPNVPEEEKEKLDTSKWK